MDGDLLKADDILWTGWRGWLFPKLGTADWGVVPVFGVWIRRVKCEPYGTRRGSWFWFVNVSHVHSVVLEGGVVMVFETTGSELASDDINRGLGELGAFIFAKVLGYARGTSKARDGARRRCQPTHRCLQDDLQKFGKSLGWLFVLDAGAKQYSIFVPRRTLNLLLLLETRSIRSWIMMDPTITATVSC